MPWMRFGALKTTNKVNESCRCSILLGRGKKNIKGKKKSPITSNSEQPNAEAHNHVSLLKTYLYKSLRAIREGEKLVLRSFRSGFYRTFESRT